MTTTRVHHRRLAAAAAGLLTITLVPAFSQLPADAESAPAPSVADLVRTLGDPVHGLTDLDTRGTASPTATQKAAATALGDVAVRWNALGTPSSLLPASGSLGAAPGTAVDGARTWLRQHAAVFGLTAMQVDALEVVNSQAFADSPARAVLFRQKYGNLVPATGGMVTVGVADGKVAYVSSSLTRTTATPAAASLTPVQGWLKAAANVGRPTEAAKVTDLVEAAKPGEWTTFTVPGLAQQQQVRLRALGMADGTVRPVFEANVLDTHAGDAFAYTVFIDAVSGETLVRRNQVDNESYQNVFTGTVTSLACGPRHSFELTDDATKSINALATGLPADDITIKLYGPSGELLTTQDLATSPELLTYSSDSIRAGTYGVEVCPFDAASVVAGPYALAVYTSDQAAPSPDALQLNPKWRYFPANPTLDSPEQTPTNSVVGCWNSEAGCDNPPGQLRTSEATGPWDTMLGGNVSTNTTVGNNANTHEAWGSPLTPGGTAQAPVSPTRDYTTPFTDAWNNSKCDPTNLVPGGNDIDASVTNLFAAHNRMHDFSYDLGFTESNYNMQAENGSRGGVGGDPEIGNAQAGAISGGSPSYLGRDNANQITLQDGTPGITNQYLFQPIAGAFYAPCTDGGMDMGIVGHEYTHAISNRMVGGPDDGLTSEQGGAMGESWSDLVAAEYHFEHDYSNGGNVWAVGVYATGNKEVAIRDYSIDKNPLNYSDYGFDSTGPEVHADGEIWNGTQWEVRQALVKKYDAQFPSSDKALQLRCASTRDDLAPLPVDHCPGNRRWLQLMFDSFLLQQGATSMLDARDAMLAADQMRFGGVDKSVMWQAFARRGMGRDAVSPDADSHEPTPSFAAAMTPNAPITFSTASPSKIYVGTYEARATPIADTIGSTSLSSTAELTPGTYSMLAVSADRGFTRFNVTVADATARTVKVSDEVNVASAAAGATVISATEGSRNAEHLIDGTEATNWGGVTEGNVDETTPSVAIALAGGEQTVRRVQVSAMLTPAPADPNALPAAVDNPDSGSRFTALRQFALEACTTNCAAADATWTRFYTSPADAFPSVLPRPVAPDLTLRSFDVPDTQAAAVRLVALHNQCTGQAAYAGEQDNDPTNDTDCKTASDRGTIVHASELQVFTTNATTGTPTPTPGTDTTGTPTPGTDTGTTATGTDTGTTGTTTGTDAGTTGTGRIRTALKVKLYRAVQTKANAAPKLVAKLKLSGPATKRLGKFVIKLDGRKLAKVEASRLKMKRLLKRVVRPGKHRVRVIFRPTDRTAYAPARSRKLKIIVR